MNIASLGELNHRIYRGKSKIIVYYMNFVKLVLEEHIYVALMTKNVNDDVRYKQKFEHWNTEGTSLFSVIIIDSKTFFQM